MSCTLLHSSFPLSRRVSVLASEYLLCMMLQGDQCLAHQTWQFLTNYRLATMCFLLWSGFCLPPWPWLWIAAEMVLLLEGSPLSTEEFWSSDRVAIGFLVTLLTKALLLWLLSLEGRVLVVPKWRMEATDWLGPSQQQKCFCVLPLTWALSQSRSLKTNQINLWEFFPFNKFANISMFYLFIFL